jgi:formylglycine-generating enzyme required for sulfatase activity
VARGGSWYNFAQFCRSADRAYDDPTGRYGILGFRVVLSVQ